MSDAKSSYGEPVEEPTPADDVIGRANAGLADAEAARAAVPETSEAVVEAQPVVAEPVAEPVVAEPAFVAEPAETTAATESARPWYDQDDAPTVVAEPISDAPTVVAEPIITPNEPVFETPVIVPVAPSPIFVQAPEAPRPRGNRGAAGAIGLLAAVSFGVLYLGAWLGFGAVRGDVTIDNVGSSALNALGTWSLWIPIVIFFIAFWLLGAIINRGRWGVWVVLGLLVGIASYGGHIVGALFQGKFWLLTASEGAKLVEGQLLAPLAIAAFVIGRELTIWFGAWVAARGRRVTELNIEARREYERTLEAGPQLVRA